MAETSLDNPGFDLHVKAGSALCADTTMLKATEGFSRNDAPEQKLSEQKLVAGSLLLALTAEEVPPALLCNPDTSTSRPDPISTPMYPAYLAAQLQQSCFTSGHILGFPGQNHHKDAAQRVARLTWQSPQ